MYVPTIRIIFHEDLCPSCYFLTLTNDFSRLTVENEGNEGKFDIIDFHLFTLCVPVCENVPSI